MKSIAIYLISFIFITNIAAASDNIKANPRTLNFPPLTYEIPKSERVVLDCGMPVYLLRDTELPIISITALVKTGGVYEPFDKTGLASLTGTVMRSGGIEGITPEDLNDELEFMASSVESHITEDMGMVSLSSLTKNFSRTLQLFTGVLLKPAFSEKQFDIARKQTVEAIRRQNDDPKEIAGREIGKAIYAGHSLGRVTTIPSVSSISRQDLIQFQKQFFRVDNIILTVSGDFDRTDILKELNSVFKKPKDLPALILPEIEQPKQEFNPEIFYGKKEVNQSVIRMGHLGITKENPDLYALRIMNYILGGSFTSRLMTEIRTNQGLAYNAGSAFDVGRRFTGSFTAETETKAESTAKAIKLIIDIITDMTKKTVSDQELKAAKDYIVNSFMFGFTNPSSIVMQQARLEYYGYQPDYLDSYRSKISAVTKEDVLKVAAKYLKPEGLKLVVVGDQTKFDKPLSTFGKVNNLDLTIEDIKGGK